MNFFEKVREMFGSEETQLPAPKPVPPTNDEFITRQAGTMRPIFVEPFDGEKNLDEIGPIKDYFLDHRALAVRSRQAYIESEIAKTVIDKFLMWVIGDGLKIQMEPFETVLQNEGIDVDVPALTSIVEPYFELYANSKDCNWQREKTLHDMAYESLKTAILSGDCLVVGRVKDGRLSFQLIDGKNLVTPFYTSTPSKKFDNGVELNAKGEHVAYHVLQRDGFTTKRIEAYGRQTGMRFAWLVTGIKYRSTDNRGLPLLSPTLETLKKLERYKEATVGSAEEAAKIVYQITHNKDSTGEDPNIKAVTKAFDADAADDSQLETSYEGKKLADEITATTNRQAYNMPIGAELKTPDHSNREIQFKDFYHTNINLVASSIGIPPEVAMSMYNSNFSASRAALKDWEHTLSVWRKHCTNQFYQPAFDLYFTMLVTNNKVQAPGYLQAFLNDMRTILYAYRTTRFVGKNVPHVDPVKEVEAIRRQLGEAGKNLPLTTLKRATEQLNNGDSQVNIEKLAEEIRKAEQEGVNSEDSGATASTRVNEQDDEESNEN